MRLDVVGLQPASVRALFDFPTSVPRGERWTSTANTWHTVPSLLMTRDGARRAPRGTTLGGPSHGALRGGEAVAVLLTVGVILVTLVLSSANGNLTSSSGVVSGLSGSSGGVQNGTNASSPVVVCTTTNPCGIPPPGPGPSFTIRLSPAGQAPG